MIKKAYLYFSSIPAVFLDGVLYTIVGLVAFWTMSLSSDDAAKWIAPKTLFYVKLVVGSIASAALNMKMYRSTSYSDHLKQKEKQTNEEIPNQPPIIGQPTP